MQNVRDSVPPIEPQFEVFWWIENASDAKLRQTIRNLETRIDYIKEKLEKKYEIMCSYRDIIGICVGFYFNSCNSIHIPGKYFTKLQGIYGPIFTTMPLSELDQIGYEFYQKFRNEILETIKTPCVTYDEEREQNRIKINQIKGEKIYKLSLDSCDLDSDEIKNMELKQTIEKEDFLNSENETQKKFGRVFSEENNTPSKQAKEITRKKEYENSDNKKKTPVLINKKIMTPIVACVLFAAVVIISPDIFNVDEKNGDGGFVTQPDMTLEQKNLLETAYLYFKYANNEAGCSILEKISKERPNDSTIQDLMRTENCNHMK